MTAYSRQVTPVVVQCATAINQDQVISSEYTISTSSMRSSCYG